MSRTERAAKSTLFKRSFLHQRCVIPVDVYYEWNRSDKPKQPYAIKPKSQPYFFLAGVWAKAAKLPRDMKPAGQVTFTLLTRSAHQALAPIHHRQPQVLNADAALAWLNCDDDADALHHTLDEGCYREYERWKISTQVNIAQHEGSQLLEPPSEEDPATAIRGSREQGVRW